MPNPKRRHSKSQTNKRKKSVAFDFTGYSLCPHCGEMKLSHHVCPHCGYYGEKPVLIKKEKKKEKKK